MNVRVVWLRSAEGNLDAILEEIERESPRAALRMALEIRGQVDTLLREHPEIGRIGRVERTRELVIARTPYIVIYRIRNHSVEIMRILHGAQQWPPRG